MPMLRKGMYIIDIIIYMIQLFLLHFFCVTILHRKKTQNF